MFAFCNGQNAEFDSLYNVVATSSSDSLRTIALNRIGWDYRTINLDSTKAYGERALALAERNSFDLLSSYSHNLLSISFRYMGKPDSALFHARKALSIRKRFADSNMIAQCYQNIANVHFENGAYDSTIFFCKRAIEMTDSATGFAKIASYRNLMGSALQQSDQAEKAMTQFLMSLEIRELLQDSVAIAKSFINLGNFCYYTGDYSLAADYYVNACEIFNHFGFAKEEAEIWINLGALHLEQGAYEEANNAYYQSAYLLESHGFEAELVKVWGGLGEVAFGQKQWGSALKRYRQSLYGAKNASDEDAVSINLYKIALIQYQQNFLDSALIYLNKGFVLNATQQTIERRVDYLKLLGQIAADREDYLLAYQYSHEYGVLQDSLSDGEIKATQQRALYDREKAKRKILEAKAAHQEERILKLEAQGSRKTIALIAIVSLTLIVIFTALVLRRFQRKRRLAEADKEHYKKLIQQKEVEVIDALVEGREKERDKIAQNMHDELGAILATVNIHLANIKNWNDKKTTADTSTPERDFERCETLIKKAHERIREINKGLRFVHQSDYDIYNALGELCSSVEGTGQFKVDLHLPPNVSGLPKNLERPIYRIVSEGLQNIMKHSTASLATIQILHYDQALHLSIEDDGRGFNPGAFKKKGAVGMGLNNMKVRAEKWHGSFTIDSQLGHGTTIIVKFDLTRLEKSSYSTD